ALLAGEQPDLDPETAIRALQLSFAVYQASNERRPVELSSIDGRVSPNGRPPNEEKMRTDVEELFLRETAPAERVGHRLPSRGTQPRIRTSTHWDAPEVARSCSRWSRTRCSSRSRSSAGSCSVRSRCSPMPPTWPPML